MRTSLKPKSKSFNVIIWKTFQLKNIFLSFSGQISWPFEENANFESLPTIIYSEKSHDCSRYFACVRVSFADLLNPSITQYQAFNQCFSIRCKAWSNWLKREKQWKKLIFDQNSSKNIFEPKCFLYFLIEQFEFGSE